MSHRQFVDSDGSVWAVWDVRPLLIRQVLAQAQVDHGQTARTDSSGPIDRALAGGWLCFECGGQKLRLAPIPSSWEALAPDDLARLRKSATAVRQLHRERAQVTNQSPRA